MTAYFIKVILCSALFFTVYKGLFENEKMLRFNRFYLLLSVVFSFIVPFVTLPATQILPVAETNVFDTDFANTYIVQNAVPAGQSNVLPFILCLIYGAVTTTLLVRFGVNLRTLIIRISKNPAVLFHNARLVLIDENLTPHSSLSFIFINTEDYKKGKVEQEVLLHELTHVQQKHSVDILFVELLQAIFWFNPVLIFYRKAILLNHEFLADERVVNTFKNTTVYQHLLIEKSVQKSSPLLSNQFNYLITKKRLIMITKSTSAVEVLCKQMILVPLLICAVFLFAEKMYAQDSTNTERPEVKLEDVKPPSWIGLSVGSTKEGVTQELLNEYEEIIDKNKTSDKKWWIYFQKNISKSDRERLETIFKQMNEDQQSKQTVAFTKRLPPLPKVVPAKEQLELWKNSKVFGVWINDKRVNNGVLNNYSNTDFAQVFVSKLGKNTVNYGKHYYQVDLMTKEYYQKYYDEAISDKGNRIAFRWNANIAKRGN